jgi:signal transduction histidine kinase
VKTGDTDLFQTLNSAEVLGVLTGSGILAVNAQGLITAFSPEAEAILGLKSSQALNQPLSSLPLALAVFLSNELKGRASSSDFSFEVHRALHGSATLHVRTHRLSSRDSGGELVALLRDLTARKQVEQHLRRLNTLASIGTLSASMAHEIKNALVAGKTFIDLLLEKHPEDELAGIVRRETDRIDGIVSQMLRFSAPGKGGFSNISLHEALDHSLRLITPKLQAKSVTLNRHFAAKHDLIEGDAYQLQQAFVNLFLNSLDAISAEGTLSVHTRLAKEDDPMAQKITSNGTASYLKLTIADTGDGISPENLARIFEPFFTTKRTGTGLGLPITRGIIEEHGGLITVESEPKNGTRFIILLPLSQAGT